MRWVGWLVALAASAIGCRSGGLTKIESSLEFSCPSDPAAVSQPDNMDVEIDFGAVGLAATKTLVLQLVSNQDAIELGPLTPVQADDEFTLPLVTGTSVGSTPQQVAVAFTPQSLGSRVAVYTLATDAIGDELIRLTLTGQGVPQGLVVAPDPITFGNVELGQTATLPVTITNLGPTAAALMVSALGGATPAVFALDSPPSPALAVGASVTFDAHFTPLAAGAASASFQLAGCTGCGALVVPLTGSGAVSLLDAAPDPIHFGFVALGTSAIRPLTITNSGTRTLHLLAPGPTFAASGEPAGFSLGPALPTTPSTYPFALAAGQAAVLPIAFVPPRLGFFPSSLTLVTDDPGVPEIVVPIDGYGGGARIACVPTALAFGAVEVEQSASLPVLCTNVGTDVPGHPEAGLLLTPGGVTADSLVFTAALATSLSEGASDSGVLLGAGQVAEIDVTYAPGGVGSDTGTLAVASNDSLTPSVTFPLSGQGVLTGSCDIQVQPAQLVFGEVPKGGSTERQLEISNASSAYCALTNIVLDPESDPAFGLPGGPIAHALLGYPGNSGGGPTSLRIAVSYAPQVSEMHATGKLDFSAAGSPAAPVPLSGSSAPACLQITPTSYDFGSVGFDASSGKSCVTEMASYTGVNVCDHAITVSALTIDSGLDATPQFSLLGAPSLPRILAPADQVAFGASFAPTSAGPKAGTISITTDEAVMAPYEVSLLGDAVASGVRTDTFTAQQNKVDLIFILDDDDDLPEIGAVAQELPGFIQAANDAHLDYRIAVTTADICSAVPSDQGSFEPCSHCTAAGASAAYFTPQTPNAAQVLSDLFLAHAGTACNPKVDTDEQFFGSIEAIFQPSLLASHNAGFLRDDAYLALVIVNDDAEDDRSFSSPQSVADFVQGLKSDPSRVSVSYIDKGVTALAQAPRVQTLVLATGGVLIDTTTRWVPGFFDLFWATERLGGFGLSTRPDQATLLVEENGVPFAAQSSGATIWTYDPVKNAVIFTSENIPVPGTAITIGYTIACH